jgi:hypothetical protein
MRASSLSNAKVIDLLNRYFVPVHVDGVYIKENASVPVEEKKAYQAVFQQFYQMNKENRAAGKPEFSVGSVHAYVLAPEGKPMASLHVAEAKPDAVADMLQRAVKTLKTPAGKPLIQPCPQSAPPKTDADGLVLHLVARYLVPRGQANARKDVDDDFVPIQATLGQQQSGQWNALPSEEWIVLGKAQWPKLLPTLSGKKVAVGTSWDIDKEVAEQLLTRFYPTTENNDLSKNRIDRQALKATVVSIKDGVVRAQIEGDLKMKHYFYPGKDDKNFVEATVVGYIDFALDGSRILTLRLITDRASYGVQSSKFGVALHSLPAAP